MVWSPDFASKVLKLKKRSDLYVGPFLGYRTKRVGFIGDGASKLLAPSLF